VDAELKVGDSVRVKTGAFASFPATVEEVSDDGLLVKVVVEILGRATPLDLQYWEVEKIKPPGPPPSSNN
jgi:transcriptional antiterminator NusG